MNQMPWRMTNRARPSVRITLPLQQISANMTAAEPAMVITRIL